MSTKKKATKGGVNQAAQKTGKKATYSAGQENSTSQESLYISVGSVEVSQQVRSNVNVETDSFKALMQSIRDRGISQPLLVTGEDGGPYRSSLTSFRNSSSGTASNEAVHLTGF